MADFDALDAELASLETTLDGARVVTQAFGTEIERMKGSLASVSVDVGNLETGLNTGLRRAFDGVVFKGMELSDAMRVLADSISKSVYNAAIKPVTQGFASTIANGIGGLFGGSAFADGGAFTGGKVMPFAKGGVISQATAFPMRGGMGLMGEAGPEAIMPLTRGADGKLGVKAAGGGTSNVTINVTTPDVAGFRRSQGQIAAQVNRALARGQRNS
ncbi:MAG: phage tail tape measure protein [Pseudomonadota bacterium]